jgi:hypothetical protein
MQRRYFLIITFTALLTASSANAAGMTKGEPVKPFKPQIKPGEYVWLPELSPAGPVVIIVSLPDQLLSVYRNGVRIGRSSVSSGKEGHNTPTGVFTILEKNVKHISTIFKGASMPYMERLTWSGVALHAGNLPGYPAAHGCVRMPLDFAKQLYTVTSNGTTVIVTNSKSEPGNTSTPALLFAAMPDAARPSAAILWQPEKAPTGPLSIIVSSADGVAYVYRNGFEIGRAPFSGLPGFTGTYVYSALENVDAEGRRDWFSTASVGEHAPNIKDLVKQVRVDQPFLASVRALIIPGTTLVLTDSPVSVSTRSDSGFNILTTAAMP